MYVSYVDIFSLSLSVFLCRYIYILYICIIVQLCIYIYIHVQHRVECLWDWGCGRRRVAQPQMWTNAATRPRPTTSRPGRQHTTEDDERRGRWKKRMESDGNDVK